MAQIQKKIRMRDAWRQIPNKIKTPDRWMQDAWRRLPATVKTAFFSAVIVGLMTHLYQFTNKLYNYDELANGPAGYGTGAESGRWFLKLAGDYMASQFGNYSLPLLNGMLSLFLIAVSAALVTDLFAVQGKLAAAAIGGFMASFTPVVCMFFFMYSSVFYSVGIFFSVLAAWLAVRFPKNLFWHFAAVILLTCSLGTYQAYFANAACIFVITLVLESAFCKKNQNWKSVLVTAFRYLFVLVAALALYLILNRYFLAHWGLELGNYQGMNAMGQLSAGELFGALKRCYADMIALVSGHVMYLAPTHLLRRCFLLIYLVLGVSVISLFFLDRGEWIRKGFMVFGFLLLPAAFFLVYLMSPAGWSYTLMGYSAVFLPVLFVVWIDQFCRNVRVKLWYQAALSWASGLIAVAMVLMYVWFGNGCYMSLEYTKYHDLAYFETMVTQIKSLEGYTDDMPVTFIGNEIKDETHDMGSMLGGTFGLDGKIESNINAYSRAHILTKFLGFAPDFCGYEQTVELMEREEVKEMSCYPDDGSMKVVDGVVVIKLSEY